jgi:hypothetical protein
VRRERHAEGFTKRSDAKKTRDARASRGVSLQDINSARFEHSAEIPGVVAILTGRDLHARRRAIAEKP